MLARIAAGFSAQLVAVLLSFVDRFLLVGLLVRTWGAEVYGDWTVIAATAGLIGLGELGLNIYFGNLFQRAFAAGDHSAFRRAVSVSVFASGALGLTLMLGAAAVVGVLGVPAILSTKALPAFEALAVLLLLSAAAVSSVVRGNISQLYRGRAEFSVGVLMSAAPTAAFLLLAVPAAVAGASPPMIAILYLACDVGFGTVLMALHLRRRYPEVRLLPEAPVVREVKDLVSHARWFAVLQGAPVAWLHAPVILLGAAGYAGAAVTGFVLMRTLVNSTRMLASMLSLAAGVELAPGVRQRTKSEFFVALVPIGVLLGALNGAVAAALLVFGPAIVKLWSGTPDLFDPLVSALLLAGCAVATPVLPLTATLMFSNVPKPVAVASLAQVGLGLLAATVLASYFGVAGLAGGLALGELAASSLILSTLARSHLGSFRARYVAACTFAIAASAAWSTLVAVAATGMFAAATWLDLALALLIWGLAGLGPALVLGVPGAQRERIANGAARILRRGFR